MPLAEASLPSSIECGALRLHASHVATALNACLTLACVNSVFPVYQELLGKPENSSLDLEADSTQGTLLTREERLAGWSPRS